MCENKITYRNEYTNTEYLKVVDLWCPGFKNNTTDKSLKDSLSMKKMCIRTNIIHKNIAHRNISAGKQ